MAQTQRIPFEITEEMPKEDAWQIFMSGVNSFTDDCFAEGRELEIVPGLRIENWVE